MPLEFKKKQARSFTPATVITPTNLKVKHGQHSGTVVLSCSKVQRAVTYEAGICGGEPSVEESWSTVGPFDHCRNLDLTGLEPGKLYYFRIRCFGKGGYSPWSSLVSLRIL